MRLDTAHFFWTKAFVILLSMTGAVFLLTGVLDFLPMDHPNQSEGLFRLIAGALAIGAGLAHRFRLRPALKWSLFAGFLLNATAVSLLDFADAVAAIP